jgi:hypothetical protein
VVSVQVPYDQAASGAPLSSRFCPLGPRDGQAPNGRNPAQHAEGRNSITHAAQEHRDFCTFGLRGIQKEGAHARASVPASFSRIKLSRIGSMKDSVLPEPVAVATTTLRPAATFRIDCS